MDDAMMDERLQDIYALEFLGFCNYFLRLVNRSFLRRCHITFMNCFTIFFILFLKLYYYQIKVATLKNCVYH